MSLKLDLKTVLSGEVVEGWRTLDNEEFHNLYAAPNIIRIKSMRVRWRGHVTRMGT
jgi:hypothetical protein